MSRILAKISDDYLVCMYRGTTHLRLFLFLSIGVVLYGSIGVPSLWFCAGGGIAFVALVVSFFTKRDILFSISLVVFLVSFGGVWSAKPFATCRDGACPVSPQYSIEILNSQKLVGKHLACDACVTPVETKPAPYLPKSYKIRLNTDTLLHFRVGQRFSAGLRVYMPRYRDGDFNYPLYLYRNGYSGVAWINETSILESRPERAKVLLDKIRQILITRYSEMDITNDNLQILSAITFGEKPADENISHNFRDAGVAHILVVSGMHVGFLFLLISLFYKRYRRWWIVVCGVALLWLYALLVGMTPSVVRATLMFTIMLLMRLSGGSYSSLNALSIAAIILLIANPMVIYNVSFQMSFLAVLSIILFYPAMPAIKAPKIVMLFYDAARLSLAAQLLLSPLVLYYFHTFPTYFLLTNVAVTLLTPVIFLGGMLTLIPLIGKMVAPLVNLALTIDYSIVKFVASLPYAILHCDISFSMTVVLILTLLALANAIRSKFSFASFAFLLLMIPVCCVVSM